MIIKLILILFEIGFGLKLNIVGTISVSEIFLVVGSFVYVRKSLFIYYPEVRKITWLYLGLMFTQIVAELLVGNSLNNSLKGFAVTFISFFHFFFLFQYFIKDRSYIAFAIIGVLARRLIFGTELEADIAGIVSGEGAVFLKFYLAPILGYILVLLSIFRGRKNMSILIVFMGFALVIMGARSTGGLLAVTGLLALVLLYRKQKIKRKSLVSIALVVVILVYGLFTVYVNQVLNGKITSGNAWQIQRLENPYNPLNLLVMGRTETFVGMVAFIDKFWTGHGAWAEDKSGMYHYLMFEFKNMDRIVEKYSIIPSHSVLIGAGVQNGIAAFLFMAMILVFFVKRGIKSLNKNDRFLIITIFFLNQVIWNGLFSPTTHFRSGLPLYFAFLLASYIFHHNKKVV